MKLTKFMCAAFAAMFALVGCNKDNIDDATSKNYKSVDIVINNVKMGTKAGGTDTKLDDTKIQLNSLQLFFSDGENLYTAYDATNQPADTYLDATELSGLDANLSMSFHFLPANVTEVLVIGNKAEITGATTKAALNATVEIAAYQDVTNLLLYAEAPLTAVEKDTHNNGSNAHLSNVYKANLSIMPLVARFEVENFSCDFETGSTAKVVVDKMAFLKYFSQCDLMSAEVVAGTEQTIDITSQQAIYGYFQDPVKMNKANWNNDYFDAADAKHPVVELTAANSSVDVNIAYNFFCNGAESPIHLLDIKHYENTSAAGAPAYLWTNKYFKEGTTEQVTTFEPGKIYRLSFKFSEENLKFQDKCVDITVSVATWTVVRVTPGF